MIYGEEELTADEIRNMLVNGEPGDDELFQNGYEICPGCGAYNAYAWQDSNMQPNTPHERTYLCGIDGVLWNSLPNIYHIGTCSAFEWECGCCGKSWSEADSPIMAECYTHQDYSRMENFE